MGWFSGELSSSGRLVSTVQPGNYTLDIALKLSLPAIDKTLNHAIALARGMVSGKQVRYPLPALSCDSGLDPGLLENLPKRTAMPRPEDTAAKGISIVQVSSFSPDAALHRPCPPDRSNWPVCRPIYALVEGRTPP